MRCVCASMCVTINKSAGLFVSREGGDSISVEEHFVRGELVCV